MSISYSAFCESLGAPMKNKNWSWCAVSHESRMALFSVWEDGIENGEYTMPVLEAVGERQRKPGRTELIQVLNTAVSNSYATYGIRCVATDVSAIPRKRKSFSTDSLYDLRIRKDGDGGFIARISGDIPTSVIRSRTEDGAWLRGSAIEDLQIEIYGNPDPEYQRRMSGSYVRDNDVRRIVLKRARGRCEYCNATGFIKSDGSAYLETHHIISLSEQGPDTTANVIALCANDHREAHYGQNWKELQTEFLRILGSKL